VVDSLKLPVPSGERTRPYLGVDCNLANVVAAPGMDHELPHQPQREFAVPPPWHDAEPSLFRFLLWAPLQRGGHHILNMDVDLTDVHAQHIIDGARHIMLNLAAQLQQVHIRLNDDI